MSSTADPGKIEKKKQPLAGKRIALKGELALLSDREALRQLVESHGGRLEELSEKTDFLVCNGPMEVPCRVLTEADLLSLLWSGSLPKPRLLDGAVTLEGMGTFEAEKGVLVKYTGDGGHIRLPKGITRIAQRVFSCCAGLESVEIPKGVEAVEESAFAFCENLKRVTVAGGVKLGPQAFQSCESLRELTLLPGRTELGPRVFENCRGLESLVIPEGVTTIGEGAFIYCDHLKTLSLPTGLKMIGNYAFTACHGLQAVEVPMGVVEIGRSAFRYCGMTSLTLPEGLVTIREHAFSSCSRLGAVVLPQSLEVLENGAFGNCDSLEKAVIPQVKHASVSAFYGCRKLADRRGFWIVKNTLVSAFLSGVTRLEIPKEVTAIGDGALMDTEELETVLVPDSVTQIGKDFLCGLYDDGSYEHLRSVVLPAHITKLAPENLLCMEERLKHLEAPGLPLKAIRDRRLLIPATIGYLCRPEVYTDPETVTACKRTVTYQKKRVLELVFQEDLVAALATCAALGKIKKETFRQDFMEPALAANATQCIAFLMEWKHKNISPADEEKWMLRELERDPLNARDMRRLWKLEATEDGYRLLGYKGKETEILIPGRIGRKPVTELAPYAMTAANAAGSDIRSVTFTCGVRRVGEGAFENCTALKTLTLSDTVTELGPGAFRWCKSLRSVTLSGGLKTLPEQLFSGCCRLKEITVPEGVTTLEAAAFRWCFKLARVQLPGTLRRIGPAAFLGCRPLRRVRVPEGVTELGDEAFAECYQLETIYLPAGLERIGKDAFRDCTQLTIHTPAGSAAEAFAKQQGIPCVTE